MQDVRHEILDLKLCIDTGELFNCIKTTTLEIEGELNKINGTGVYFAPELYVSFCIGKNIFKNRKEIFNSEKVEWQRELAFENSSPTDNVFKVEDNYTVLEIKLRDKVQKYNADVEKLKKLSGDYNRFFCVMSDCFIEQNDNRLNELQNTHYKSLKQLGHFSFPTWSRYKKQVLCNLNLYQIG